MHKLAPNLQHNFAPNLPNFVHTHTPIYIGSVGGKFVQFVQGGRI